MKLTPLLFFLTFTLTTTAQNVTENQVEPQGEYKQIDMSKELLIIQQLGDSDVQKRNALIDSVEHSANNFTPSLLYIMSAVIFNEGQKETGMYWFYIAQLRARYDTNRCTDKTASPARYNMQIGPPINQYAFTHLDSLESVVNRAINYVTNNPENYDQRWINMEGMGAFTDSEGKPLSLPKKEWPSIKAETIETYSKDFKEALATARAKQK